jgi:NTP pyrophosphatase (non-canonical NTP hydrolase)
MKSLNILRDEAFNNARAKGWHDEDQARTFGDYIALMHSELSEALEEYRSGKGVGEIYFDAQNSEDILGKPCGIPIELADVLIRILDFCGDYSIDIETAVNLKMSYNQTRPHRHGGKVI